MKEVMWKQLCGRGALDLCSDAMLSGLHISCTSHSLALVSRFYLVARDHQASGD